MAGPLAQMGAAGPLRRVPWRSVLAAFALALLAHTVVLGWLAATWQVPATLQAMATPMLTREIRPSNEVLTPKPLGASVDRPLAAINSGSISASAVKPIPSAAKTPTPTLAALANPDGEPVAAASKPVTPTESVKPAPEPEAAKPTPVAAATPPEPDTADRVAQWPADTRLNYQVSGYYLGDLHGKAQVLWQRQAERYQVKVSVDMGLVDFVMTSQGRVQPEGLHPGAYEEKVTARGRRSVELTETQLVMNDGQRLPRPPRVQDTASQFVELTWRFLTGQITLQQGATVRYWMARPGGADEWLYDVVALDTLQTRIGPVPAWHLVPRPLAKPRGNVTAEMWFAPSLQYLPVRIKMNIGADSNVDMLIDKIER